MYPIIPKVAVARWRSARVIISLIMSNASQRSRSSASAVHRIAKCDMRTCGRLAIFTTAVVSGLFMGEAAVFLMQIIRATTRQGPVTSVR